MSLIYDALRKSEEQRRAGELPSLSTPTWQPRRRPPSRAPWIAGALFVVVAVAIVFALNGEDEVPAESAPAEIAAAPAPEQAAPPVDVNRRPRRDPPPAPPLAPMPKVAVISPADKVPEPPPKIGKPPRRAASTAVDASHAAAIQQKFEQGEVFANNADQLKPAAPTAETPYVPPEAAMPQPLPEPDPAATAAQMPAQPAVAPKPATPMPTAPAPSQPLAMNQPTPTPSKPPVPSSSTVPTPPPSAPGIDPNLPAVPLVYELPLATRQALPALKLNMHVYNADPARRFVIIDGTRATEGQAVSDAIDVTEIRPDGIVLRYEGQTFLLPRGGR